MPFDLQKSQFGRFQRPVPTDRTPDGDQHAAKAGPQAAGDHLGPGLRAGLVGGAGRELDQLTGLGDGQPAVSDEA